MKHIFSRFPFISTYKHIVDSCYLLRLSFLEYCSPGIIDPLSVGELLCRLRSTCGRGRLWQLHHRRCRCRRRHWRFAIHGVTAIFPVIILEARLSGKALKSRDATVYRHRAHSLFALFFLGYLLVSVLVIVFTAESFNY